MTTIDKALGDAFDAVIMFTWSDWRTEPRSNRYHYATRLARRWPVYFVQMTEPAGGQPAVERVEGHDVTLVHLGAGYGAEQSDRLHVLLRDLGVRKPLYWVYNPRYLDFIERYPGQILIYHATEDHLGDHEGMSLTDPELAASFRRLLTQTDLTVAVTHTVAENVRAKGLYGGPLVVARNGCDLDQWRTAPPDIKTGKIAFYQGGINDRLDYDLLLGLADALPDWTFQFCGNDAYAPKAKWAKLKARPNVEWLGVLGANDLAAAQGKATVGLIPFRQVSLMKASLPLKAYEYVASGLPVVTIPIDELAQEPDQFLEATDVRSFARQIKATAPTRHDPAWLERRRLSASAASYDGRFAMVTDKLAAIVAIRARAVRRRNVLVLYDPGSVHVATVREHLESFSRYSVNHVHYMAATGYAPEDTPDIDISMYDVVINHYSLRLSITNHMLPPVARALERFTGLKIAFLQDEYETVDTALAWLRRLRFDILFTCIPMQEVEKVYRRADFPWMRIVPNLTGYLPDDAEVEIHRMPMRERKLVIGYRGRRLSHFYGDLGQEKIRIGEDVRKLALAKGIPVDIEVDEEHRIYGRGWYEFLANARATLGTESGSNVFDFDGSLKAAAKTHNLMPYDEFRRLYLEGREDYVRMNQISPKIFEAVRLHVALVLFEGEYSGVVQPNVHYIPLKKDLSNIDDVFARLEDLSYLQEMTERAYRDIVDGGRYSYRQFAANVDAEIEASLGLQRPRGTIFSIPTFAIRNSEIRAIRPSDTAVPGDILLPDGLSRMEFVSLLDRLKPRIVEEKIVEVAMALNEPPEERPLLQRPGVSRLSHAREKLQSSKLAKAPLKAAELLWRWTPKPVKSVVRRLVR